MCWGLLNISLVEEETIVLGLLFIRAREEGEWMWEIKDARIEVGSLDTHAICPVYPFFQPEAPNLSYCLITESEAAAVKC